MTGDDLVALITAQADAVERQDNVTRFDFDGVPMVCIFDTEHDRMRIIAPIARESEVNLALVHAAMQANFHTALDARYAISGGILYAAFLHPLSSLDENEVDSALHQVASLVRTFGTTFSSGGLQFPGRRSEPTPRPGVGT